MKMSPNVLRNVYLSHNITYSMPQKLKIRGFKDHNYLEKQRYIFARRLLTLEKAETPIIYYDESAFNLEKMHVSKTWQHKQDPLMRTHATDCNYYNVSLQLMVAIGKPIVNGVCYMTVPKFDVDNFVNFIDYLATQIHTQELTIVMDNHVHHYDVHVLRRFE